MMSLHSRRFSSVRRTPQRGLRRRAAAAVEAAICLPIFILLTFGVIESCNCIFLRQGLLVASYEGARVAIVPGATRENVEAQVQEILRQRNIRGGTVTIDPPNFGGLRFGSQITVEVEALAADNHRFMLQMFSRQRLRGSTTMMMETF